MESSFTKRDVRDIEAIIQYCERIDETLVSLGRDEDDFLEDYVLQSSCAFSLIQIGEAVKDLSKRGISDRYPDIEWSSIARFRDIIVHHYGKIDLHVVWKTAVHLVPELKAQCEIILKDLRECSY